MTDCQTCHRPTQNYLCDTCTDTLTNQLEQLDWLLTELDNRIQKRATGPATIGTSRGRPDHLNPIDFDAADLAHTTRQTLTHWVTTIATHHTGRTPPALTTVTSRHLAAWLHANTHHIARHPHAGHLHRAITQLVGTDHQPSGQLVRAINHTERHLVGECPTITGRTPNGTPRQCAHTLYADTYDRTTTCPNCHHTIDVETTRLRTAANRDLHTTPALLELLANIDEPITAHQLHTWTTTRRLRPAGYLHDDTIIEFRIHPHDQPVYSLDRTRRLRRRDNNHTRQKHH